MRTQDVVLWEVDVQADFMLPGGKLYVPGAEKLLPNIQRLTDCVRRNEVFLVSHGCFHTPDDPEFQVFPPHCVKGTAGARLLREALADSFATVPNTPEAGIPGDLSSLQQIILEKQTLDVFQSQHADTLLNRLHPAAEFVVFGVVTEYCVRLAVEGLLKRGRKVSLVGDAIETLKPEVGRDTLSGLRDSGAQLVTTDQALARLSAAQSRHPGA